MVANLIAGDYPFGVRPWCFAIREGRPEWLGVDQIDASGRELMDILRDPRLQAAHPDLAGEAELAALLCCGSNASPSRLAQKLAACARPEALGLRLPVRDWAAVYAATVSPYGALPATLEYIAGAEAYLFLVVTLPENLEAITATETRDGNYDLYRADPDAARTWGLPGGTPIYAYIARQGALRLEGETCPLVEFVRPGARGFTQSEVRAGVTRSLGQSGDDLVALKSGIIDLFGSRPNAPGFALAPGGDHGLRRDVSGYNSAN